MSTLWPRITLVTCSYQQVATLDATIRSVLDQGYPNLEYIVMDGGSRDGSVAVIRSHAHALAHWESRPDAGQTAALIAGFARGTGAIQGWLCSDDLLLPGCLFEVARHFARHPATGAVYGDALWIDAAGNYLRPKREMAFNRFALLFDHNFVAQPAMFWRSSLYREVGGLDARFVLAMDGDLWERFSRVAPIDHVPAWWACMRSWPGQKTRRLTSLARAEAALLRERMPLGRLARAPAGQAALCGAARLLRVGAKALAGGYRAEAPRELLYELRRYRIVGAAHGA